MRTRTKDLFTTIRTEGGLLPADFLQRIGEGDGDIEGLTAESYHLPGNQKLNEAINRSWNVLLGAWEKFGAESAKVGAIDTGTSATRESWLLPLFQELGYGRVQKTNAIEIDGKDYPVSHAWGQVPMHFIGFNVDLDKRSSGVAGAARISPHGMVQELLNRTDDHLWAFVSNGHRLRVLRDNVSLTRQAYVEFDLYSMLEGEVYSDFVVLWLLCHQSRVEAEQPEQFWLEKWMHAASQRGTRALETLRQGVEDAISALGSGFISHPANQELKAALRSGDLSKQDFYRQILRTVYRIIFLFVAEDRDLLFAPDADKDARQRYMDFYSTRRLRNLAQKKSGTKHGDLWQMMQLVFQALSRDEGCPELGLYALGSFLWSAKATPDLDLAQMSNRDLLDAFRHLAVTVDGNVRRVVDYRNLGAEELGSIYESLLEMHPDIHIDAGRFELNVAAGNERKTTGSYYTPTSLVNCLLDSALDPVVEDRLKEAAKGKRGTDEARKAQEQVLLDLSICDPACGSGHFLIAAAHRVAKRLAAVRTGDEEPSPAAYQQALRDVVGHCIYGIDINPMAVELCKVSLWMEAMEPGRPLGFLDHHIVCGNSLLGATPALIARGIPDDAFKPLEGDDKKHCSAYKKRNKQERKGQQDMLFDMVAESHGEYLGLADRSAGIDAVDDRSAAGIRQKAEKLDQLRTSSEFRHAKLVADAWCSAFVIKKTDELQDVITEEILRRIESGSAQFPEWLTAEIERLASEYQFLHLHLAFPHLFKLVEHFDPEDIRGWQGGFDCVLGNPPWEKITLLEREYFADRPGIVGARTKSARAKAIAELSCSDQAAIQGWQDAQRKAAGEDALCRQSGRFPLTAMGELNTYQLFTELSIESIIPTGRVGFVTKTGILNAKDASAFVEAAFRHKMLVQAVDIVNIRGWFPDVVANERFCLLTLTGRERPCDEAELACYCLAPEDALDDGKHYTLSLSDLSAINPNTLTLPTLSSARDAELLKSLQRRTPILVNETSRSNEYGIRFGTILHSSGDSALFTDNTAEALNASPDSVLPDGTWELEGSYLPYYEGKMIRSFNHRHGTFEGVPQHARFGTKAEPKHPPAETLNDPFWLPWPRYWVRSSDANAAFSKKDCQSQWLLALRKVCRGLVDARTVQCSVIPLYPCSDSITVLHAEDQHVSRSTRACLLNALFCSFPLDWVVRQKLFSANLQKHIIYQLPVPSLSQIIQFDETLDADILRWVRSSVLELTYTAWDLAAFAADCEYSGPPFIWDEDRRFQVSCELDALFFHLYGIERDDVDYIMETFPIVKRKDEVKYGDYRTKLTILKIYDEMTAAMAAGQPYQTHLDPPPGPPTDEHGNFLPLPEWRPGQSPQYRP